MCDGTIVVTFLSVGSCILFQSLFCFVACVRLPNFEVPLDSSGLPYSKQVVAKIRRMETVHI